MRRNCVVRAPKTHWTADTADHRTEDVSDNPTKHSRHYLQRKRPLRKRQNKVDRLALLL